MRNIGWLRYSLASLTLLGAGLATFVVACGDDDATTAAPKPDAGDTDTGAVDQDSGPTPDAGPTVPNAKLQLVNAATDLGPSNPVGALRFCYGLGPAGTPGPLPPLPDRKASEAQPFPGVFIGTGGAAESTGIDLTTVELTPYLMNAQTLAQRGLVKTDAGPPPSCLDLFTNDAGGELVEGKDYWKLPSIPANTLVKDKSFILVLTGCAGDSALGADKCGAGFVAGAAGNGNLKVTVYEVDHKTTIDADKIGTQFIHASPAGATALAAAGGVIPGYTSDPADAGAFKGVTADAAVPVDQKSALAQVSGVNVQTDSFTANPNVASLAIPLPLVQLLTYGGNVPDGGAYRNGAAFTFIALGDPEADADAGGTFNTKKFHYIALPNDPAVVVYKP